MCTLPEYFESLIFCNLLDFKCFPDTAGIPGLVLCTSMLEQSIDLCSACSSKGATVLALLEHRHNNARSARACSSRQDARAYSSAIVAKMPEYPRGPLFECAPAAKTLSHAQVTHFEHARDA